MRWSSSTSSSSGAGGAGTSKHTPDEVSKVAKQLEEDPELLRLVMDSMTPEARRHLIVAGGAYEWFGREKVETEVKSADYDQDRVISPKDFDKWFDSALKRHNAKSSPSSSSATTTKQQEEEDASPVPFGALVLIAIEAGLPFVGFGFLDNGTMVLAGDAIDKTLGVYLHCSVMASAAMGNVVSGCMGMQVHGFIEKLVMKLGLPVPQLSETQRRSQRVFLAGHIGGTLGIAIGLTLGMLPLLFISENEEKTEQKIFDMLDKNDDGCVSAKELVAAILSVGVESVHEASVLKVVKSYSDGNDRLNFEQFQKVVADLKENHLPEEAAKKVAAKV